VPPPALVASVSTSNRWSDAERLRLAEAVAEHGTGDWPQVCMLVGTKTWTQCRNYYANYRERLPAVASKFEEPAAGDGDGGRDAALKTSKASTSSESALGKRERTDEAGAQPPPKREASARDRNPSRGRKAARKSGKTSAEGAAKRSAGSGVRSSKPLSMLMKLDADATDAAMLPSSLTLQLQRGLKAASLEPEGEDEPVPIEEEDGGDDDDDDDDDNDDNADEPDADADADVQPLSGMRQSDSRGSNMSTEAAPNGSNGHADKAAPSRHQSSEPDAVR